MQVQALLIVVAIVGSAHAAPQNAFSMEEPFVSPVGVSPAIARAVERRLSNPFERFACVGPLEENLEAMRANLGRKLSSAILVKPRSMCLCGARSCHFWVLYSRHTDHDFLVVGEVNSHTLKIAAPKHRGAAAQLVGITGGARGTTVEEFEFKNGRYELAR